MAWLRRRSGGGVDPQAGAAGADGPDPRPDLLLVMSDQQRHDQTGYASGGLVPTPTLDRWAARGTTFTNACSGSTTCVPARVSLLTGVDAHRVRVLDDGYTLQPGFWTVAHALRAAGYQTALVGKMHFIPHDAEHGFDVMHTCEHLFPDDFTPERLATPNSFDRYHDALLAAGVLDWRQTLGPPAKGDPLFPLDAGFHPTPWIADRALEVLRDRDPRRPLFLVVSFPHPHEPHNPPEPYASMVDPDDVVVPAEGFEVNDGLPETFLDALTKQNGVWGPNPVPSETFLRRDLARVYGLIRQIDDAVERVLAHVDRDRTVAAFTSDHGDYAGHRGLMRKIPWIPFEDLIRVPLLVDAPDAVPGRTLDTMVSTADLPLTFLDYAGVDADLDQHDGRSLRPLLTGAAPTDVGGRDLLFSPNSGWPTLRRGRYKLVTRPRWLGRVGALFDLEADPGEVTDLAGDAGYRAVAAELEDELERRLARPMADLPVPAPGGDPDPVGLTTG